MKIFKILLLSFLIVACKSNKPIVSADATNIKKLSARKVLKKHQEYSFSAKTLDARINVRYSDNRTGKRKRNSLKVRLRMHKDSVIWLKGSKVVSAFRAKITPTEFSYYSPLSKEYFTGDYTFLKQLLGVEVNFNQLQNLFLGQSVWELKDKKFSSKVDDKSYKLTPKKQEELYSIFFYFHPNNFRLKKQFLEDRNNKTLRITYPSFIKEQNEFFLLLLSL